MRNALPIPTGRRAYVTDVRRRVHTVAWKAEGLVSHPQMADQAWPDLESSFLRTEGSFYRQIYRQCLHRMYVAM